MEKLFYSVAETVSTLGLGRTSVYGLIKSGQLRVVKIGRRTLVSASSLREITGEPSTADRSAGLEK